MISILILGNRLLLVHPFHRIDLERSCSIGPLRRHCHFLEEVPCIALLLVWNSTLPTGFRVWMPPEGLRDDLFALEAGEQTNYHW